MSFDLSYHQKPTLVENIINFIHKFDVKSLLDIGAGSPVTALPISHQVERYLAVEQDPKSFRELRKANLNVIQGKFPVVIENSFDLVLSSHSIPENSPDSYSLFLTKAWELIKPGGHFLIITFKGSLVGLDEIRQELFNTDLKKCREYEIILDFFRSKDDFHIQKINSYIESKNAVAMADFLAPWLVSALQQKNEIMPDLINILNARYKVRSDLYVFPTEHLFISCKKSLDSK